MWDICAHLTGQYGDPLAALSSELWAMRASGSAKRLTCVLGDYNLVPLCGIWILTS